MKNLSLAAAVAIVTLSLASPAKAQYVNYQVPNYSYNGNPYVNSNYTPNVYGPTFNYQNSYGYNPNAYGYNGNSYFSPSNGNLYRNYNNSGNYGYRTYTYRYNR